MRKLALIFALCCIWADSGHAQVALAPSMHPQFLTSSGQVLSGGFLYTYSAGTTTRLDTFTDNTGAIQNVWPIPLDATGAPSNGSTQTGIWLSNASYKFCAFNSAMVQQWCVDNVSAYQILNGVNNITFGSVTSDPSGTAGELGYRSDLGCFRGFTAFWDCLVTLTSTQTLTNKTVDISANTLKNSSNTAGHYPRNNGMQYVDSTLVESDAVQGYINNAGVLPNLNGPVKLTGSPSTITATAITDTGGVVGICVSGCATPGGTGQVQSVGIAPCVMDNAFTSGDYVTISAINTGGCHDAGATYPTGVQILGRVTSASSTGTAQVRLFPPEIKGVGTGAVTACTTIGPVSVTNTVAQTTVLSCTIPANTLAAGSLMAVDLTGLESTASGQTFTFAISLGGGTACNTFTSTAGVANNQPFLVWAKLAVLTAGGGGTANWACGFSPSGVVGLVGNGGVVGAPTISLNTTISNTLTVQVTMSVANAGNSTTGQLLKAVIF